MAVIKSVEEKYMKEALKQAKKAYALGEVPIGCVIVHEGKIIGRGYNRRNTDKNTLAHAEITAINKASKVIGDWRLEECTLYVTLEPCQMCAGAIVQARIPEVVMGCMNPKAGCAGSILNILEMPQFKHQVKVTRAPHPEQTGESCQKGIRRSLVSFLPVSGSVRLFFFYASVIGKSLFPFHKVPSAQRGSKIHSTEIHICSALPR